MKKNERGHGSWVWAGFFLLLWQVLLSAQNPGLMSDDSGEIAAASYTLGLPHPPGFPLICLLGHLVSFLPIGTVAFRLNLFSAFLTLFSIGFILDCCRRAVGPYIFKRTSPFLLEGFLALLAIFLVSGRSLFSQCLTAKGCVYSLTLFTTSILIWHWIARQESEKDPKILFAPFFLWGMGFASHWPTMIFWAPFLIFLSWKLAVRRSIKTLLFAATFTLFGLSLYLYLPLRTLWNPTPCWGNPINLEGFLWVVTRKLVTGWEPLVQSPVFYLLTLKELMRITFLYWPPWSFFLFLVGLAAIWKQDRKLFNGLVLLFVPIFIAVLAVHEEKNIYLMHVYLLSLSGIVGIFVFAGMISIAFTKTSVKARAVPLWLLGLAVLSCYWLAHTFRIEDKSRYTIAEDFGTNALKDLPQGALFLPDGDHYVMPIWYGRVVRGQRPDIIFEPSVFLYHGWGWRQLILQSRDLEPFILSTNTFVGRLDGLANKNDGHPFCYSLGTNYLGPVLVGVPGYLQPWGLVYRWKNSAEGKGEKPAGPRWLEGIQRTRGLSEWAGKPEIDFSTQIIFRYYDQQRAQEGL